MSKDGKMLAIFSLRCMIQVQMRGLACKVFSMHHFFKDATCFRKLNPFNHCFWFTSE